MCMRNGKRRENSLRALRGSTAGDAYFACLCFILATRSLCAQFSISHWTAYAGGVVNHWMSARGCLGRLWSSAEPLRDVVLRQTRAGGLSRLSVHRRLAGEGAGPLKPECKDVGRSD
eukprot:1373492-Pleurochrysis_carterae.AAC.1